MFVFLKDFLKAFFTGCRILGYQFYLSIFKAILLSCIVSHENSVIFISCINVSFLLWLVIGLEFIELLGYVDLYFYLFRVCLVIFSCLLLCDCHYTYVRPLDVVPQLTEALFIFKFLSFLFQFDVFHCLLFRFSSFLLQCLI